MNIYLVLSGKGGVGKSTFSVLLAYLLDNAVVVDFDVSGPSIAKMSGTEDVVIADVDGEFWPVKMERGSKNGEANEDKVCIGRKKSDVVEINPIDINANAFNPFDKNIAVVSPYHIIDNKTELDDPSVIAGLLYKILKNCNFKGYKNIVIDTPPGITDEHLMISSIFSEEKAMKSKQVSEGNNTLVKDGVAKEKGKNYNPSAILVTTPSILSFNDTIRQIDFCKKVGVNLLGVVENMKGFTCECGCFVGMGDVDVKQEIENINVKGMENGPCKSNPPIDGVAANDELIYLGGIECKKEIGMFADKGLIYDGQVYDEVKEGIFKALKKIGK